MLIKDHRKPLNSKILVLKFFGFWDLEPCTPFYIKLLCKFNYLITVLLASMYGLSVIMDLLNNLDDFSILIENGLFLIIVFMVVFKLYVFRFKNKKIRRLTEAVYRPLDFLQQLPDTQVLNIINDTINNENLIDKISEFLLIGINLGLVSVMFFNFGKLPLRGKFFFDLNNVLFYMFAAIIQTGTATIFSMTLASMDDLIFSYIRWINSQFRILILTYEDESNKNISTKNYLKCYSSESLKDFHNLNINDAEVYKLKVCYKSHHYLYKVISELNSIFSSTMLVQISTGCCIICLSCFQLVTGDLKNQYKLLFFFGGAVIELFNFCWFGSELIYVSNIVSDGTWSSGWERNLNSQMKSFMLMSTVIAKYPLQIEAGCFFIISLDTFVTVLRNAYSFFVLLSTMNIDR